MSARQYQQHHNLGFTLIELSIVLVVIGLIVGGILAGQDLIKVAEVRAQISQIGKYNTAVNTFKLKYNSLPGDIPNGAQFGFVARSGARGRGNGNGIIEGYNYYNGWVTTTVQAGETLFFWEDLSYADLIDTKFNTATDAAPGTITDLKPYIPQAKIGSNFVYNYNSGIGTGGQGTDITNYFGVSASSSIMANYGVMASSPGLSVLQAYNIDKKADDGMPQSGKVSAKYVYGWSASDNGVTYAPNAASDSSATCFNSSTNSYSLSVNGGANLNCALSFEARF